MRSGSANHKTTACVIFFGVRMWLVTVLGQFSIIYFRGLGLRFGLVWCYGAAKFRVRVRIRVRVVNMFGGMVRVNTTQNLNPQVTLIKGERGKMR